MPVLSSTGNLKENNLNGNSFNFRKNYSPSRHRCEPHTQLVASIDQMKGHHKQRQYQNARKHRNNRENHGDFRKKIDSFLDSLVQRPIVDLHTWGVSEAKIRYPELYDDSETHVDSPTVPSDSKEFAVKDSHSRAASRRRAP